MTALTIEQTRQMLISAADAIISQVPLLTELDSAIGDGDHGVGMGIGMEKAKEALMRLGSIPDVNTLYKTMGMAMLTSMGGTSGVIFSTAFMAGVKGMEPFAELDCQKMKQVFRNGLDAAKQRGQARVGDKTMVDAYEPAGLAMEAYCGSDMGEMLSGAAMAAEAGAEKTKEYIAKFGRARYLGERAVGHRDAGATSVSIIVAAMRDYVKHLPQS